MLDPYLYISSQYQHSPITYQEKTSQVYILINNIHNPSCERNKNIRTNGACATRRTSDVSHIFTSSTVSVQEHTCPCHMGKNVSKVSSKWRMTLSIAHSCGHDPHRMVRCSYAISNIFTSMPPCYMDSIYTPRMLAPMLSIRHG